jgi:arginase
VQNKHDSESGDSVALADFGVKLIDGTPTCRRRDFCRLAGLALPAVFISRVDAVASSTALPEKTPMKPTVILDAPSNLGLRPPRENHEPGVWRLPQFLRAQGVAQKLGARDAGTVPRLPYSPDADPVTGFRNGPRIAAYTRQLADKIGALVEDGLFPLVIGGDCSILVGIALGLRRRGRYGLCFIDGHNDFSYARDPKRHGLYAAAGLDLALATGHGPDALTNIDGLKPYIRHEDVAALGVYRDPADEEFFDIDSFYRSGISIFESERVRKQGAESTAARALEVVSRKDLAGFWIHLDADVLHESVMPAVDSPNPGGISFAEVSGLLRVLLASPHAVGMHVTILDPELDPEGKHAANLVDAIATGFASRTKTKSNGVPDKE